MVSGSSTFEAEPTATNIFLPSGVNWMSRVQCPPPMGKLGEMLGGSPWLQVTVLVGKANHGIGVADVDPLRVIAGRIKGDAVGTFQPAAKTLCLLVCRRR